MNMKIHIKGAVEFPDGPPRFTVLRSSGIDLDKLKAEMAIPVRNHKDIQQMPPPKYAIDMVIEL